MEISKLIADFRDDRPIMKEHNTEGHLLALLHAEYGELLEAYDTEAPNHMIDEELADVIIYCYTLLLVRGENPESVIREKVALNHAQHPSGNYQEGNYREQYVKSKSEAKQINLKGWWYE